MAKQKKLIETKKDLIFKLIWVGLAVLFGALGLAVFFKNKGDSALVAWVCCGALCGIPVITDIIKGIIDSARKGRRDGANDYTATQSGNTITVSNHPFKGMILGIVGGIIGALLVGPILLAIKLIGAIVEIVAYLMAQKKKK